jgi:formate--tetrahydrofolate ligase
MKTLQKECANLGVESVPCYHWTKGGGGATELAKKVVGLADSKNTFKVLYEEKISLLIKLKLLLLKFMVLKMLLRTQKYGTN